MIFGTETEYGIQTPQSPTRDSHVLASLLVAAIANRYGLRSMWDFGGEYPNITSTDFAKLDPDQRFAQGQTNTVMTNGARIYVDHSHPEYATPEVLTPTEVVAFDRAGDWLYRQAARDVAEELGERVLLTRDNTDGKRSSWGFHENYLLPRDLDFGLVARVLTQHFVSRLPLCGSGRLGSLYNPGVAYQISQRAEFFEQTIGIETTQNRPIINTRDEPHSNASLYRRLHVITSDTAMNQFATWLKVGTTGLILAMLADGRDSTVHGETIVRTIGQLATPVQAMHAVSHDLSCNQPLSLASGTTITALGIQTQLWQLVADWLEQGSARGTDKPAEADELMAAWQALIQDLGTDPQRCADRVDWVSKYQLLSQMSAKHGQPLDAPAMQALAITYHDIAEGNIFSKLERSGRVRRIVSDDTIAQAVTLPPATTRAWLRGTMIATWPDRVSHAGWSGISVHTDEHVHHLPLPDPYRGTMNDASQVNAATRIEDVIAIISTLS